MPSTFSFVDLAGYSAASWAHGDDLAAQLAIALHDLAVEVAEPANRIVKSIGDAVLCRSEDPRSALEWHRRMLEASADIPETLELRAGCHEGEAVERDGDFYGTTINIAARITALAEPGELLATDRIAAEAASLGWPTSARGPQLLRNIADPIDVWAVGVPAPERSVAVDPVCHMRLLPGRAKVVDLYHGRIYGFCSEKCHAAFVARPSSYVER